MGRILTIHEAVKILNEHYITDSIQMVSRWIRDGRINASKPENRKEGYKIYEEDLYDFIDEVRPGLVDMIQVYKSFNDLCYEGNIAATPIEKPNNTSKERPNLYEEKKVPAQNAQEEVTENDQDLLEYKVKKMDEEIIELQNKILQLNSSNNTLNEKLDVHANHIENINGELTSLNHKVEKTIEEINGKFDDLLTQIKNNSKNNKPFSNTLNSSKNVKKRKQEMSEEIFLYTAEEILKDKFTDAIKESLKNYYPKYMDENGMVKDENYDEEGNVNCPIVKGNKSKSLKVVLKKSLPIIVGQITSNEEK